MKYFYRLFFIFLGTLPLFFAGSLLFLKDPLIWPDEAIYLDTARTLAQTGRLATNIFGGAIPGLKQHAHWYPPLYFHLLALWTNIFGSSIESVRFLSFLLALFSLITFFFIVKVLFDDERLALLGTIILAVDFSFSRASRVARMDMFSFFLLVFTLLAFFLSQKQTALKKSLLFYLLTGVLSGLAVLTHPLGFIAPTVIIAYLLILLIRNQFYHCNTYRIRNGKTIVLKLCLIFFPTLLALFFWFFSMRDSFGLFLEQYHLQFLRKAPQTPFPLTLWYSNHSWKIIFSLYGLTIIALFFQLFLSYQSINLFISLGLIISTVALLWGKEMWYTLYFQPFITLALLSMLKTALSQKNTRILFGFIGAIFIVLILNFNMFVGIVQQLSADSYDYHRFTKSISDKLPSKATIFLATIPDPYFDLKQQKNKHFQIYEFPTVPVSDRAYKKLLDSTDYLILNMMPDKRVENYMNKYTDNKTVIGQPGQFSTIIFKLVTRNKRSK